MRWRVYYSDGSTICSEDATPSSLARRVGIQAIVQEDPEKGWIILCGYDYFVWDARGGPPKWFRSDEGGFFQYITQPGSKHILLGEWIDDLAYREVLNRANADRTFAAKTGYTPWERKP